MQSKISDQHKQYLVRETAISAIINAGFSALFVFIVFGGRRMVSVTEVAVDAFPQSFMIALMSTLIPTALTRRRLATGAVPPLPGGGMKLPRNLLLRALLVALLAALLGGGLSLVLLPAIASSSWQFASVLAYKIIYGSLLAIVVTPVVLRRAFSDSPRSTTSDGA